MGAHVSKVPFTYLFVLVQYLRSPTPPQFLMPYTIRYTRQLALPGTITMVRAAIAQVRLGHGVNKRVLHTARKAALRLTAEMILMLRMRATASTIPQVCPCIGVDPRGSTVGACERVMGAAAAGEGRGGSVEFVD